MFSIIKKLAAFFSKKKPTDADYLHDGFCTVYSKAREKTQEEKRSANKALDELDRNCNTCMHLTRTKHTKNPYGFLAGICNKDNQVIQFHPSDPMHKKCWVSRDGAESIFKDI